MPYANPVAGALREGRQGDAVPDLGALTAAAAVGDAPTAEEHDAVVADLTALHAKINTLLGELRQARVIASS